jgi:hypothetical protein
MKKYLGLLLCIVFVCGKAQAQSVAINTDGSAADSSALLDLKSSVKGMLAPRMTGAEKTAIINPATGLILYQTDATDGFYYNAGTPLVPNWLKLTTDKTPIAFSATTTIEQIIPSSVYTKVLYPVEEFDESGNFVPGATSEFTTPSTGIYHFDAVTFFLAAPNTTNYITIFVNNAPKKTTFNTSPFNTYSLQVNADLKLTAGDVVDIRLFIPGGGTQMASSSVFIWFSGRKIN